MKNKIHNHHQKKRQNNKNQITLLLGLYLIFLTGIEAAAQVNNYIFNCTAGIYSSIAGNTLFSGNWDDENSALLPLPFSFTYNDIVFQTISISSNGFTTLGELTSTVYCGIQASGANSIAAYGTDLMGNSGSTVQYGIRGMSPGREFIIQWSDCAHYLSTTDHYTFQIILHETSNIIEVVYGPFIAQTTMGANNCHALLTESGNVGLKGRSNADINIRKIVNGINDWNSSFSGSSIHDVCNLSPLNFPAQGLTYRWTPPATLAMMITSCTAEIVNKGKHDLPNSLNNPIVRLKVETTGQSSPVIIDSISFSTVGSTNTGTDLSEANIYMTGNSEVFSASNRFGYTFSDPDGMHTINGQATLQEGNNYFWLTFDISSGATFNDTISGCIQYLHGSNAFTSQSLYINCPEGYQLVGGASLNLTVLFEGFYQGNRKMMAIADTINHPFLFDTITVELHQPNAPFDLAFKSTGIINIYGNGQFLFPNTTLSHSYYLVVRYRYCIETWSKNLVSFNVPFVDFDFSSP